MTQGNMQFVDLHRQYAVMKNDLRNRMDAVHAHKQFVIGAKAVELENRMCAYTGAKHAITCSNGTDAMVITLIGALRGTHGRGVRAVIHVLRDGGSGIVGGRDGGQ